MGGGVSVSLSPEVLAGLDYLYHLCKSESVSSTDVCKCAVVLALGGYRSAALWIVNSRELYMDKLKSGTILKGLDHGKDIE